MALSRKEIREAARKIAKHEQIARNLKCLASERKEAQVVIENIINGLFLSGKMEMADMEKIDCLVQEILTK